MSGLQSRTEDTINGVDVRESGSALRVATNTPHLVSLGTGRLSTAVTLHPIKQGRVTIGSDPTCDIYVVGTGVASVHCRVENSHGVVTLYPVAGSTLLDTLPVDKPTRLSQGSMLTIGRSNYLRFNHPAEAKLMKSVLPSAHVSMAPTQFTPNDQCLTGYVTHTETTNQCYQKIYKDPLSQLDQELDVTLKEMSRIKPPVAPKKYREFELSDSDQETKPKMTSIMAKVSKFEYYAKQHKNVGRSQFYTNTENEISPKVFSSNSLTVNTPAKDVLGGKSVPNYINKIKPDKIVLLNENNSVEAKSCSYANVAIRNNTKIGDIVKNFDDTKLPKKVNNDQVKDNVYGKINIGRNDEKNNLELSKEKEIDYRKEPRLEATQSKNEYSVETQNVLEGSREFGKVNGKISLPSPAYDRNPQYAPVYTSHYDRPDAENMRMKAYQERIKEEEKKEAEMERLEEILDIFTEYQRQLTSDFRAGIPITPTEKRSHNKIITNGSLPRSVAFNNPNFVKTSEGYYKFETSHSHSNSISKSLPTRNVSGYENFDVSSPTAITPEVTLPDNNYENIGRMDEIGIPVFDDNIPSPVNIRRNLTGKDSKGPIPSPSPYENVYVNRNVFNSIKPKSPNTNSPRTRIKTTFAHKNVTAPQYFVFPTPPPVDNNKKPNFNLNKDVETSRKEDYDTNRDGDLEVVRREDSPNAKANKEVVDKFTGIEKQLSLEEEIPMIDDARLTNDIEFRYSKILTDKEDSPKEIQKVQSFDDVKKELMADIPELEAFEKDLKQNKRDKIIKNITEDIKKIDIEEFTDNSVMDVNIDDLKSKYEKLKEERRKLVTEIHEIKCKMTEIRSQEDDILRELEMEKALIKGEYDSEIAILNIEQKKKSDLVDKAKKIEGEIKQLKEEQEGRQNEMRDRVEVATLKVERLEKDWKTNAATLEELQNAQDILDNETKIFEDLEFQHLEEESELLSNREDLQNDIILLTKKIEAQKTRILTLKSEANNNLTSALDETKVLHAEFVKNLNQVEELTSKVQSIEKELKPIVAKLNEIERAQSPDSAFYTDQTRTKSGEFGYSPQSSDSDDIDIKNFEEHTKEIKDKFNSIDQMSQSMTVDIERKLVDRSNESPFKPSKEKKGFWERNFDSLKRKKKPKSPEKVDVMSQSFNENLFYNSDNIETEPLDRFNSLRNSKKKEKKDSGPVKSSSSSKIPTFAALGKIIKKDSFGKKSKENEDETKNRYIKNSKPTNIENKYVKAKSLSPDKVNNQIVEETTEEISVASAENSLESCQSAKILHRKSCGDEPSLKGFNRISDKIPSQDDIDRISKVTIDAPLLSSDTDMNSLGKRTFDSLMEVERKRMEMLEEQGCQMIENEREKISELKRRVQDETKKLWDQRREKSIDSDLYYSLTEDQRESGDFDRSGSEKLETDKTERTVTFERTNKDRSVSFERSDTDRSVTFDQSDRSDRSDKLNRSFIEKTDRSDFDRSVIERLDGTFDHSVIESDRLNDRFDRNEDSSLMDDSFIMANSTIFEESSGLMSSSIEELQVRNSRTESTEDDKRSDDSRPLSHASDFSRDNILSLTNAPRRSRRGVAPYSDSQRPLTRYLPVDRDDFDLRRHVESAGHQIELCPYVTVTSTSCRGYLHKLGAKFHTWSKRWFVFDRESKTFVYYWDKSEKKPRGGAYFQVIEEVYLDHGNTSRSPSPATTFIVKTRQRRYCLMAASGAAARIWIDVIFTGAQGYTEYLE